ncbi:MAG: hypothetical protein HOE90_14770 [Bacteriovoracaceae bacterium]|jgi:myo-inositol catabolism protein IolS|nr:hypothetical protein [Bacteriovoracaceae bacterium]
MRTFNFLDHGFPLSTICFGGASISGEGKGYGFGPITEDESIRLLKKAFEAGINFFDTAPIYGFGSSEIRMGKAFKDIREKVFLISKCGIDWHSNTRVNMTNDPAICEKMLGQSLERLQTDYIDLYMIHWPDQNVDIRDSLKVLVDAKKAGKIKYIGLCNTNVDELEKAREVCKIDMVQSEYNLFADSVRDQLFPYLEQHHIPFMGWGTFQKGILTKRVDASRKFDSTDCRSSAPWWKDMNKAPMYQAMEEINPLLDQKGVDGVSLALSFSLGHPAIRAALVGMRNEKQLESTLRALENLAPLELVNRSHEIATKHLMEVR